jgi:CMP-N-acetylneuraminic acid synthetase
MKIAIIPAIGNRRGIKSKNIKDVIILKFSTVDINDKEN